MKAFKQFTILICLLLPTLVFAGGPSAADLNKRITAPAVGKSIVSVDEFVKQVEKNMGGKGSWANKTVYKIDHRDKHTLKKMWTKIHFDFEVDEAILTEIEDQNKRKVIGTELGRMFSIVSEETPSVVAKKQEAVKPGISQGLSFFNGYKV